MNETLLPTQSNLKELLQHYEKDARVVEIVQKLTQREGTCLLAQSLAGSLASVVASALFKNLNQNLLFILPNKEEAAYFLNDLEVLLPKRKVLFYPASYRRPYQVEEVDNANILLRAEVLNQLNNSPANVAVVSFPDALFEKVLDRKELLSSQLKLRQGDLLGIDFINETLFEYHFERVDFVTDPGQFSIRGGIVDVFSFAHDHPYRIEFLGDEVDSIRYFDTATQLSTGLTQEAVLMPNMESKTLNESRVTLLEFMGKNTSIWLKEPDTTLAKLNKLMEKAEEYYLSHKTEIKRSSPTSLFMDAARFKKDLQLRPLLIESRSADFPATHEISFGGAPQPSFNKKFDLLLEYLNGHSEQGIQNLILCSSASQVDRFYAIFNDIGKEARFQPVLAKLHEGFEDTIAGINVLTDHQIFERFQRFTIKNQLDKKEAITLKELNTLQYGDYVTHLDYGIGKFAGLQKIDNNGKVQEAIKLIYKDEDILYVSIQSLHKIARFNSKEGTAPTLNKLGTAQWAKKKEAAKKKVKEIAFDLIKLYAKRRAAPGFQFSPDTYMQHELEASFIYEDTPDQEKATADVKADMEKPTPMDRLICGDVGFGKTEIAIRAALKAAVDGKQVAVLVPTTILAFQHYKSFSERLKDLPVTVDYINRFKTAAQQKATLEKLADGKIDIIIGTHILVGKKIKFKDLGLMIIDEEQKFGVAVKDKLKTMKVNLDTLTLTATPIPRTLQFSLMAARDLSIMTTPPPNRHPIDTQIVGFNEEVIRDSILYEINRGGQAFFIHNRIENIKEIAGMIQRLLPDIKVGIGHGQMEGQKLEEVMLAFMEGEFDVLVSTSIIENGLDVPNANTILIHQAQNFGLSDLHQMRGRVGRGNKQAFCKLITPPLSTLSEESRKRLRALEQFSDLGSGFKIAMKDLEIRGAGSLFGGEQSGFITDIGFDTYQKILAEAIEELKENDFKDLYPDTDAKQYVKECSIDTDAEILFPDEYINQTEERLRLYQELDAVESEEALEKFEKELIDRFGPLPEPAKELLLSIHLRMLAKKLGFERIVMKNSMMLCYFIGNKDSKYFQSEAFGKVLALLAEQKSIELKDKNNKLYLRIPQINTISQGIQKLNQLV